MSAFLAPFAAIRSVAGAVRRRPPTLVVVGDAILDRWCTGRAGRMSREAPVPVVEVEDTAEFPGGAANTAANIAALGARTLFVSVVGDDDAGRRLRGLLSDAGVGTAGLLAEDRASTTTKTRIAGDDQILVRIDRTGSAEGNSRLADALGAALRGDGTAPDVLVICDYGNGLFDEETIARIARMPRPTTIVDAHDPARWRDARPDVITPNAAETAALIGHPLAESPTRLDGAETVLDEVRAAAGARGAVITLDRSGTVAVDAEGARSRTFAHPALEKQASGAGDTFTAAVAVAVATGSELAGAAAFAQLASDVVVRRPGTGVCSLRDLEALAEGAGGPLPVDELEARLWEERRRGRRIVFTNGCFDVLHRGHALHLRQAAGLGDVLVVALNDDDSVRRLKGPDRPVNAVADRCAVLEALGCVDCVTVFSEDSPAALLERLRPDVYAKGGDYTPEMLAETDVVRAYGGEVTILDYVPHHSTSDTIRRIVDGAHSGVRSPSGAEG